MPSDDTSPRIPTFLQKFTHFFAVEGTGLIRSDDVDELLMDTVGGIDMSTHATE